MSRDKIEVRECDRCKTRVEARDLDVFAGWGLATATGEKDGEKIGFANADLCPDCFDYIVAWFALVMRERDAQRTAPTKAARPVVPTVKAIAKKLISDNLGLSPEMEDYFAGLDVIGSLDDLREYQAGNALTLMRWMANPETSAQLQERHQATYQRLAALTPDGEPA